MKPTSSAQHAAPIRILTAVPVCDGHDTAISTINMELVRGGIEVIYLGFHRAAASIARAAVQEDVRAVGISSYNGGHVEFFGEVLHELHRRGAKNIGLFGGGGGTIRAADASQMRRHGTDRVFFAGTPLDEVLAFIRNTYGGRRRRSGICPNTDAKSFDATLGRLLTHTEEATEASSISRRAARHSDQVIIGVTGPGGAGKTTLIDELVLRFLNADATARIAVLSHDPSLVGSGALLGDRAMMIHSQNDRVFMRSLATRGQAGGLSRVTEACLDRLIRTRPQFDVIFIETVGIGQEAAPFEYHEIDWSLFVMSAEYGARLQLQKIAMLDRADLIVVNKAETAGARTAVAELEALIAANRRGQRVVTTVAKHHRDAGVDALFQVVSHRQTVHIG